MYLNKLTKTSIGGRYDRKITLTRIYKGIAEYSNDTMGIVKYISILFEASQDRVYWPGT